jgi:phage terminase small subunit
MQDRPQSVGYSPASAKFQASHLLADPVIPSAIDQQLSKHVGKLEVDAEMVISGIVESVRPPRPRMSVHGRCRP